MNTEENINFSDPFGTFNAEEVEPARSFEAIPDGNYTALIQDTKYKPMKSGNGQLLEVTLQVIEGDYKGRLIWDRLSLVHNKQQVVDIAKSRLSSICRAINLPKPGQHENLRDKPVLIGVGSEKYGDTLTNRVLFYKSTSEGVAAPADSKPGSPDYDNVPF